MVTEQCWTCYGYGTTVDGGICPRCRPEPLEVRVSAKNLGEEHAPTCSTQDPSCFYQAGCDCPVDPSYRDEWQQTSDAYAERDRYRAELHMLSGANCSEAAPCGMGCIKCEKLAGAYMQVQAAEWKAEACRQSCACVALTEECAELRKDLAHAQSEALANRLEADTLKAEIAACNAGQNRCGQ